MAPKKTSRLTMLLLASIAIAACFYLIKQNADMVGSSIGNTAQNATNTLSATDVTLTYNYDDAASFYAYNSNFFYYCTKDGIKFIDANTGTPKWESVFTLTTPLMVGEKGYVVVGEPKGNVIYVYGPDGPIGTHQLDGGIINFTVNAAGSAAAIIKKEQGYEARIFLPTGGEPVQHLLYDVNTVPVSIAISNDGRIASIALLDINNLSMATHVISEYLLDQDANRSTDDIFSSDIKKKQIVAALKFLEGNHLIAFSDTAVSTIALKNENTFTATTETPLTNKIDFMGYFGDTGYVLAYGDAITEKDGKPTGHLAFYDAKGVEVGTFDLAAKATYLNTGAQHVVVGVHRNVYVLNNKGKLIWESNLTQDYKQLVFLENSNGLLLITNTEATVMKRGN